MKNRPIFMLFGFLIIATLGYTSLGYCGDEDEKSAIIPVEHDDPRVTPEFAALGNMYQIENFILSAPTPENMPLQDAIRYCEDRGGTLPRRKHFKALARAMGKWSTEGYQQNLIPNMADRWFWSLSYPKGRFGYVTGFDGDSGDINYLLTDDRNSVFCMVSLEPEPTEPEPTYSATLQLGPKELRLKEFSLMFYLTLEEGEKTATLLLTIRPPKQ